MTSPSRNTPTFRNDVRVDLVPGSPFGTVTVPAFFGPGDLREAKALIGEGYELMSVDEYWVRVGSSVMFGVRRTSGGKTAQRDATAVSPEGHVTREQVAEAGIGSTSVAGAAMAAELELREYLREHLVDPVAYREADDKLSALLDWTGLAVGEDLLRVAAMASGVSEDELNDWVNWALDMVEE